MKTYTIAFLCSLILISFACGSKMGDAVQAFGSLDLEDISQCTVGKIEPKNKVKSLAYGKIVNPGYSAGVKCSL